MKDINPKDLDWALKKIIEHLQDLSHHAFNSAEFSEEQKERVSRATLEIAAVVAEKHREKMPPADVFDKIFKNHKGGGLK